MAAGAAVAAAAPRPRLHRVKTACTATPTTKVTTATEAWSSSPRGASEADALSAMPTALPAPPLTHGERRKPGTKFTADRTKGFPSVFSQTNISRCR